MDICDKFPNKKPTEPIYHYTSLQGLAGILESGHIWATDARYLKDRSEFTHGKEVVQKIIETRLAAAGDDDNQQHYLKLVLAMLYDEDSPLNRPFYIASFCEVTDVSSLWRSYCPSFSGFSFGYDWNPDERQELRIAKCIYRDEEKEDLIEEYLDVCFSMDPSVAKSWFRAHEFDLVSPNFEDTLILAAYFVVHMNIVLCSFKHRALEGEREWRIISFSDPESPGLCYRVGKKGMIPYRPVSLVRDNEIPIEGICVGPTEDIELAQTSLKEYSQNLITKSGIPVRCKKVTRSIIPVGLM